MWYTGTIDMCKVLKSNILFDIIKMGKKISQSDPVLCMYKYVYRGTIWLELKKGVGKY